MMLFVHDYENFPSFEMVVSARFRTPYSVVLSFGGRTVAMKIS